MSTKRKLVAVITALGGGQHIVSRNVLYVSSHIDSGVDRSTSCDRLDV